MPPPLGPPAAGGVCNLLHRLKRAAHDVVEAVKTLFSRKLWAITLILIFVWTISAFVYYGEQAQHIIPRAR
jgi:hypothetical protein